MPGGTADQYGCGSKYQGSIWNSGFLEPQPHVRGGRNLGGPTAAALLCARHATQGQTRGARGLSLGTAPKSVVFLWFPGKTAPRPALKPSLERRVDGSMVDIQQCLACENRCAPPNLWDQGTVMGLASERALLFQPIYGSPNPCCTQFVGGSFCGSLPLFNIVLNNQAETNPFWRVALGDKPLDHASLLDCAASGLSRGWSSWTRRRPTSTRSRMRSCSRRASAHFHWLYQQGFHVPSCHFGTFVRATAM